MTTHSFRSDIAYVGDLVEAGWNGAVGAKPPSSAGSIWAPAAAGAAVGALSAIFVRSGRPRYRVMAGGLLGAAVGIGGVFTMAAARGAARRVTTVRDAHWLESHPIAYA